MTLESFLASVTQALKNALINACPVDTGELKQSIDVTWENGELKVYMAIQGIYTEFGTKPHIIRPKDKKALAWGKAMGPTSDGNTKREFVAKEVHHPGTSPNPWIRNTFYHKLPRIVQQSASYHLPGTEVEVTF